MHLVPTRDERTRQVVEILPRWRYIRWIELVEKQEVHGAPKGIMPAPRASAGLALKRNMSYILR